MLLAGAFDQLNKIMTSVAPDNQMYTGVESFVYLLANIFIVVALGLSVLALAFGFISIATGSGDPKNTQKAQQAILWGGIGLGVSFLAYALKTALIASMGIGGLL